MFSKINTAFRAIDNATAPLTRMSKTLADMLAPQQTVEVSRPRTVHQLGLKGGRINVHAVSSLDTDRPTYRRLMREVVEKQQANKTIALLEHSWLSTDETKAALDAAVRGQLNPPQNSIQLRRAAGQLLDRKSRRAR